MARILVLGAAGMLGHKLCQRLAGHEVIGAVRGDAGAYAAYRSVFETVELVGGVDVLDGDRLEVTVRRLEPDVVVNCIGIVKQLEEAADAYLSVAINSLLPHRLAALCAHRGARLLHVSTDCVFDGARGSYTESDPADARDLYGRSKALGETGFGQPRALTLRTSFIGRELKRPTHGLVEWFLAQARQRDRRGGAVNGFRRAIYSGLTSIELARVIQLVVDERPELEGVLQAAGPPITKHDLLVTIRDAFGLAVEIRGVDEPAYDRSLSPAAFLHATGYTAPTWPEMIRELREDPTPYDDLQAIEAGAT